MGELGLVGRYKVVGVMAIALALVAIVILANIAIKNIVTIYKIMESIPNND
ncbi:hypothetical protein Igag_0823 [Ignisphaera aggregans DSM 17230]|uniref:Uncharacterized protein n=1 Tax=Ignisphaera aggregans (strain DSM 17230 / JCM 13409 / AQ1.S1) TaxID=583356 RepID=E0STN0_IGNAA|nr:hypothetical protein Igag_0823 [Ignisphaera aggregans DSM 17230]